MIMDDPGVKRFRQLSDAVGFVAQCLQSDDPEKLMSQLWRAERLLKPDSWHGDHFREFVFGQLKKIHEETDLQALYQDRIFPEDDTRLKLGGHMSELGCIHIDFAKRDEGWVIHDIWLCR